MSKITRKISEIVDAVPGRTTIAEDRIVKISGKPRPRAVMSPHPGKEMTPSAEESARAAEEFAHLPLVVRWSGNEKARVTVWTDGRGNWFRKGGVAQIRKPAGEERRFEIVLYTGANKRDLTFLQQAVEAARSGKLTQLDWRHITRETASWFDGDDDLYFQYSCSHPYKEPFLHADPSPLVFPCEEPACSKRWHSGDEYFHIADEVQRDLGDYKKYSVTVEKDARKPKSPWTIDIRVDEFTEATPAQTAELISDLNWMAEACRRLNATVEA